MADSDQVKVQIGTDASQGTSGMKDAQEKIADSLNAINDSLKKFGEVNKQIVDQVKLGSDKLVASFEGMKTVMSGSFNALPAVVGRVRGAVTMLAGVLAGGIIGKESVEAMLHMEQTVRDLEIVFGMSSEKATQMAVSLKLAGIEAGQFEQMGMRILMRLRTQSDEFERLGIKVKDATGHFLPMQDILQSVYKRMQDFKAGADQDLFVLSAIGRNAKDFAGEMQRLNAVQNETNEVMRRFGIEMGSEEQANIEQYRIKVNAFKVGLEAIGEKIGAQIMPSLLKMGEWLGSVGPSAASVLISALKILATVLTIAGDAANALWQVIKLFVVGLYHFSEGLYEAGKALAHLDFRGAADAAYNAWQKMKNDAKRAADDIVNTHRETIQRIQNLWSEAGSKAEEKGMGYGGMPLPKSGTQSFTPKPKGGDTRLAEWKEQLRQMQEAEGFFHEMSKAAEITFWEEKLALVKGAGIKEVALRREINKMIFDLKKAQAHEEYQIELKKFDQEIEAAKYNKDQQLKLAADRTAYVASKYGEESVQYQDMLNKELKLREAWVEKEQALLRDRAKHAIDMGVLEVDMERTNLDQQVALRNVSADQKYAIEQDFENRIFALRLKGLRDELATLHEGTLAWQQKNEEIEKLETDHQLKMTQIANQAELERKQAALTAAQDVQNAFATFLDDIANRTKSLKNALLDMVKSLTSELNKLAANEVAKNIFGPGTTGGGFLNNIFGKIFGGGTLGGGTAATSADAAATAQHTTAVETDTLTTTTQSNLLQTAFLQLTTAAQQASAALMSINETGGGGMGGGLGELFGGGGGGSSFFDLPFFEVGTPYVPQDTLAYVHKGEAIVPADKNRMGFNGRGALAVHNQFVISGPIDTRTQDQINAAAAQGVRRAASRIL